MKPSEKEISLEFAIKALKLAIFNKVTPEDLELAMFNLKIAMKALKE